MWTPEDPPRELMIQLIERDLFLLKVKEMSIREESCEEELT